MAHRLRLGVIGTSYLGATDAVCMAELGYDVLGVDVDEAKVKSLSAGEVPFYEPGLAELLAKHTATDRLRFTTSYDEVVEFADVLFVCVGTPQLPKGLGADLRYVEAAFSTLAAKLDRRVLVVGKSTVPAGTAARMRDILVAQAPEAELAWNPEFLREGFAVADTLRPDRLVFGVESAWAEARLREVFAPIIEAGTPVVVTDFATAELVKVAANSFLATKISFVNAMAEMCDAVGADVAQLADAMGYDARIGRRFLNAGLGFGGGCLPKDIRAFIARAEEVGVTEVVSLLEDVDRINLRRRTRTVALAREVLGGSFEGRRVAVLGAAFKPDSDDIRDSPALDVAAAIHDLGADVIVFDPHAMTNGQRAHPDLHFGPTAEATLRGADLVLLLTEWDEFRALDPERVATLVRERNVIDARMALDADAWRAADWSYRALGRP
ncbi:MAG TPA: UDP-glucose/GDP-mannose dehydrogenase family protein [Jatrophihabitantaceae bacterium]|nr:UDP-glucose/GDP-mannose dehydrogenase family protein [Jatrophihabitantaceae bacterium]